MAPSIVPWILLLILHNVIKGVVTLASGNAEYDIDFTTVQISMKDVLAGIANSTLEEIVTEGDRLWDQELQDQLETSPEPAFNTTILDVLPNETFPTKSTDSITKAMFSMWLNSSTSDVTTSHNVTEVSPLIVNSNSSHSYKTERFTSSPLDTNAPRLEDNSSTHSEDTSSPLDTSSPSLEDNSSTHSEDTSSPRPEDTSSEISTPPVLQNATLHNAPSTTELNSRNTSIISSTPDSDELESTRDNLTETSTQTIVKTTGRPTRADSGQKEGLHAQTTRRVWTDDTSQGIPNHTMFLLALVISIIVTTVLLIFSVYVCCKIRKRYIRQVYTTRTSKDMLCLHNMAFDIKIESSNNNSVKPDDTIAGAKVG